MQPNMTHQRTITNTTTATGNTAPEDPLWCLIQKLKIMTKEQREEFISLVVRDVMMLSTKDKLELFAPYIKKYEQADTREGAYEL